MCSSHSRRPNSEIIVWIAWVTENVSDTILDVSRFTESPNRSMHDGERECESASDSPGWATPAVLRPRVLALCRKRPDAFAAQRQHAFPHFDTTSSSPARIAPGGDTAPRESRAELGRYAWAHICSLSLTGCLFWMRRNVRQRAEDPGAVDVEDGVPPPRAAPPLLRRVVLNCFHDDHMISIIPRAGAVVTARSAVSQ